MATATARTGHTPWALILFDAAHSVDDVGCASPVTIWHMGGGCTAYGSAYNYAGEPMSLLCTDVNGGSIPAPDATRATVGVNADTGDDVLWACVDAAPDEIAEASARLSRIVADMVQGVRPITDHDAYASIADLRYGSIDPTLLRDTWGDHPEEFRASFAEAEAELQRGVVGYLNTYAGPWGLKASEEDAVLGVIDAVFPSWSDDSRGSDIRKFRADDRLGVIADDLAEDMGETDIVPLVARIVAQLRTVIGDPS